MISKVLSAISKGLAFIYVFLRYKLRGNKHVNNSDVLIIFGGQMGNAILHAGFLEEIQRYYSSKEEANIYMICNKRNLSVLNTMIKLDNIKVLDVEYPFSGGGTSFSNVKQILNKLKGHEFDKIIVNIAHILPLASYIVAATSANQSIGVFDDLKHKTGNRISNIDHNFGGLRWYFERAYTDAIKVNFNTNEVQRLKLILNRIGDDGFKVKINPIPQLAICDPIKEKYVTIAVDSSTSKRRIEIEKLSLIADYVIGNYGYSICTTGTANSKNIEDDFVSLVKNKSKIIRKVGKTNFNEWVELIRNAEFHIGVDSGSIHVAASVGTQAFCMVGGWDGKRAYPYCVDIESGETKEPICVYMDKIEELPCYGCKSISGAMGYGNSECYSDCSAGRPCYCLKMISASNIINAINEWKHR